MKSKFKFLSVFLILAIFLGATASAMALEGRVHGGRLRLRANPIPSGIYYGYIPNQTVVTV
ncbi:MAG: hypothetical protein ACOYIT_04395 [Christensenellales bacterium]|jgi:hypothetical protein